MSASSFAASLVLSGIVWWALAEGRPGSWTLGVPVVLLAAALGARIASPELRALRPLRWLRFAGWFVSASVRAGWQVAWIAFRGRAALTPAVREVRLERTTGGWATLAAYVTTLVPGTCTIDLDGEGRLTLHALVDGPAVVADVRALEARLAAVRGAEGPR
jgi:multicomponent Na+:H+ antiporter subunit E